MLTSSPEAENGILRGCTYSVFDNCDRQKRLDHLLSLKMADNRILEGGQVLRIDRNFNISYFNITSYSLCESGTLRNYSMLGNVCFPVLSRSGGKEKRDLIFHCEQRTNIESSENKV